MAEFSRNLELLLEMKNLNKSDNLEGIIQNYSSLPISICKIECRKNFAG
jgi:hypothetical protein